MGRAAISREKISRATVERSQLGAMIIGRRRIGYIRKIELHSNLLKKNIIVRSRVQEKLNFITNSMLHSLFAVAVLNVE
jgi:hypothetical protein